MLQNFISIEKTITERIESELKASNGSPKENPIIQMVLGAYNRFQIDERESADYIFDLTEKADLVCLAEKGVTIQDLTNTWNSIHRGELTPYVCYNSDYPAPHIVGTTKDLISCLVSWLPEFMPYVLMYVSRCKEYATLYDHFVTEYLEQENYGK